MSLNRRIAALMLAVAAMALFPAACAKQGPPPQGQAPNGTPGPLPNSQRIPETRPEGVPSRGRVAYWAGGQLIELDLATWTEKAVADVDDPMEIAFDSQAQRVAVIDTSPADFSRRLYIVKLATVKSEPIKTEDEAVRGVKWSPDDRYLAVESGTAVVGGVAIIDLSTSKQAKVAGASQIDGCFSGDSRYYAYSFPVDVGLPVEGGGSSGIAVFDLATARPVARVLLDGRDGFSYALRGWAGDSVVCSRTMNGESAVNSYGMVALDGQATVLPSGDPRLRPTAQDAMGRLWKIVSDIRGPQTDLSPDGRWLLTNLQINGEDWVVVWDSTGNQRPVPLAKAKGAAWVPGTEIGP